MVKVARSESGDRLDKLTAGRFDQFTAGRSLAAALSGKRCGQLLASSGAGGGESGLFNGEEESG